MIQRYFVAGLALAALVALAPASSYAQDEGWTVPRTADGQPDLQGVWDFRTLTPLQRPANRAEATLTAEEAAEIEARSVAAAAAADQPSEVRSEPLPAGQDVGGYNAFWFDRGAGVAASAIVGRVSPSDDGSAPCATGGVLRIRSSVRLGTRVRDGGEPLPTAGAEVSCGPRSSDGQFPHYGTSQGRGGRYRRNCPAARCLPWRRT